VPFIETKGAVAADAIAAEAMDARLTQSIGKSFIEVGLPRFVPIEFQSASELRDTVADPKMGATENDQKAGLQF